MLAFVSTIIISWFKKLLRWAGRTKRSKLFSLVIVSIISIPWNQISRVLLKIKRISVSQQLKLREVLMKQNFSFGKETVISFFSDLYSDLYL